MTLGQQSMSVDEEHTETTASAADSNSFEGFPSSSSSTASNKQFTKEQIYRWMTEAFQASDEKTYGDLEEMLLAMYPHQEIELATFVEGLMNQRNMPAAEEQQQKMKPSPADSLVDDRAEDLIMGDEGAHLKRGIDEHRETDSDNLFKLSIRRTDHRHKVVTTPAASTSPRTPNVTKKPNNAEGLPMLMSRTPQQIWNEDEQGVKTVASPVDSIESIDFMPSAFGEESEDDL